MKTYKVIVCDDGQTLENRINENAARGWVIFEYRVVMRVNTPVYTAVMEKDV